MPLTKEDLGIKESDSGTGKWKVNIFGGPNSRSWEISVVREGNSHGQESYGWYDDNKRHISCSGGPCQNMVCKGVWDKLVKVAHEVADEMNEGL